MGNTRVGVCSTLINLWSKEEKEKVILNICITFPRDKTTTLQNSSEVWWSWSGGRGGQWFMQRNVYLKNRKGDS